MLQGRFDVIVLGVGGMGSAALFELSRRGRRVLGLEQFDLVHDRGSSHGHTRVIRKAYFEHPNYVPLARRAYERWYDLEQRSGRHLFTECGCLSIGPAEGELVAGVQRAASEHNLPIESFNAAELGRRYSAFRFDDRHVAVLERDAGFLYVEDCVRAHIEEARKLGAEVHANDPVESWHATASGVEVHARSGRYAAERLIITAGPWAGHLLARWGAPLTVMRQVLLWFGTSDDALFRRDRFPIYICETPEGHFYGFPAIDPRGAKAARHYGQPELPGPDGIDRTVSDRDEEPVRAFLKRHLPGLNSPRRDGVVCIYTLSPDRHFIIDLHPEHNSVALATGFSGHGFKFASVVGEILADLAENGRTALPIEMFRLSRFGAK
jgi:sarcosine oxidase